MLAQHRGDYDAAEPLYRRSLEIKERIGDQAGMATSYHQLGMLAQDRGDYDTAEPLYRRSLEISERIGDQAGMATATTSSASWPSCGGTTTPPSRCTAGPWRSASASATRRAWPTATASSASLAQDRGDYDTAEPLYRRSLEISERIGDQAAWPPATAPWPA